MSVTLPDGPYRVTSRLDYLSYGTDLSSPLGGSTQRVNRLGDRFALTLELPSMRSQNCGGVWNTLLSQAIRQGAIVKIPKPLLRVGTVLTANPLVNGGGQAGMTLNADGFTAGAEVLAGQYFSFTVAGVNYLHRLTAAGTANASGQIALAIEPMLRVSLPDNTLLEFIAPKIEGLISRDTTGLAATRWGHGTFDTITITENR